LASAYNYITISDINPNTNFFSTISANYTDAFIESLISQAEYYVNSLCGDSFSGTIPDEVKFATIYITKILIDNEFIKDGFLEDQQINIFDESVSRFLTDLLKEYVHKPKIWVVD